MLDLPLSWFEVGSRNRRGIGLTLPCRRKMWLAAFRLFHDLRPHARSFFMSEQFAPILCARFPRNWLKSYRIRNIPRKQRRSVMMEKEFPQKVSIVGEAHQVRVKKLEIFARGHSVRCSVSEQAHLVARLTSTGTLLVIYNRLIPPPVQFSMFSVFFENLWCRWIQPTCALAFRRRSTSHQTTWHLSRSGLRCR